MACPLKLVFEREPGFPGLQGQAFVVPLPKFEQRLNNMEPLTTFRSSF